MSRFAAITLLTGISSVAFAQSPMPRPALPGAVPSQSSGNPLANPQVRPVPVASGIPVYRNPTTTYPIYSWGTETQPTSWTTTRTPWRMPVQTPNWNPMLPAGWNPNPAPLGNGMVQAGWNAVAPPLTPGNTAPTSPRLTIGSRLTDRAWPTKSAFGVNPVPVLFP
jgi:hypothetical protein